MKIAYKLFEQTDENGLMGWPSYSIQINDNQEQDYIDAGYYTDYIFAFEAYKESMIDQFNAWVAQYKPEAKIVKITNLTKRKENPLEPPIDIDFISGLEVKLHRKSILIKGECIREEYYENYSNGVYSNLIVQEESTYTRDSSGFPIYKTVVIKWTVEDGLNVTFHEKTKSWVKYYLYLEKIEEGKIRRGNLINNLQIPILGFICMAMTGTTTPTQAVILEARRFLADYEPEFTVFVSSSTKTILDCLSNPSNSKYVSSSNYSWIDWTTPYGVTIREYIISEMTI